MSIFPMFQKKTEAPKNYEIPAVSGSGSGEYPTPEEYNLTALEINKLYINNVWVRKYINTLVRGCLKYKLQAVAVDGVSQGKVQKRLDEVNALLSYANPSETFKDVREKYLKDFFMHGNGVLELAPRNGRSVKELYAGPAPLMRVNVDNFGNINKTSAYYFVDPQTSKPLPNKYSIDDIVHFKLDQISDRIYGISPLEATSRELAADTKAAKEMGRGDFGNLTQVISVPKQSKTFVDKLLGLIQQTMMGKSGNKVVVCSAEDIKAVKLSDKTFKDEFEFQKWLVQRHNVYGVPPFKLGFVSEVGSMSAKEQREEFLSMIDTFVTYECEKLTLVMCRQKFGYEDVKIVCPELITRIDYEKARVLDRLVASSIITPNEARERYLGMPRSDEKEADQLVAKTLADALEKGKALPGKKDRLLAKQEKLLDALAKKEQV